MWFVIIPGSSCDIIIGSGLQYLGSRQNRLGFVYIYFKSCYQSLVKTSLDFSNIFRAIPISAMSAKRRIHVSVIRNCSSLRSPQK